MGGWHEALSSILSGAKQLFFLPWSQRVLCPTAWWKAWMECAWKVSSGHTPNGGGPLRHFGSEVVLSSDIRGEGAGISSLEGFTEHPQVTFGLEAALPERGVRRRRW